MKTATAFQTRAKDRSQTINFLYRLISALTNGDAVLLRNRRRHDVDDYGNSMHDLYRHEFEVFKADVDKLTNRLKSVIVRKGGEIINIPGLGEGIQLSNNTLIYVQIGANKDRFRIRVF